MKKTFLFVLILTLFLIGCGSEENNNDGIVETPVELPKVHKSATVMFGKNEKINFVNWYRVYTTSESSLTVDISSDKHESFSSGIITQNFYITNNSDYEIIKLEFLGTGYKLNSTTDANVINTLDYLLENSKFYVDVTVPKDKTYGTFLNFFSVYGDYLTSDQERDKVYKEILNTDFSKITVPKTNINFALDSTVTNLDNIIFNLLADITSYSYDVVVTFSNGQKQTISNSLDYSLAHNIKVVENEYSFNPLEGVYNNKLKENIFYLPASF